MEPKPRLNLQPDDKRRRPLDSVKDAVEPGDVDEEEDQAWKDWINDETGTKRAPLPPVDQQPEMGIHAPTPEMDEEDERRQEEYHRRRQQEQDENHPGSGQRGVWEMKQ